MNTLPNDPVMMLSVVNTLLRDRYSSLEDLAKGEGVDPLAISQRLGMIDYSYNRESNQFK